MTFDKRGSMYVGSNRGCNNKQSLLWITTSLASAKTLRHSAYGGTPRWIRSLSPNLWPSTLRVIRHRTLSKLYLCIQHAYGGDNPSPITYHQAHGSGCTYCLQVSALRATYVHELQANGIRSKMASPAPPTAYYTLNRIPNKPNPNSIRRIKNR